MRPGRRPRTDAPAEVGRGDAVREFEKRLKVGEKRGPLLDRAAPVGKAQRRPYRLLAQAQVAIVKHVADEVRVEGEVDLGRVMPGAKATPGGPGQRLGDTVQVFDVGEHGVVTGIRLDAEDRTRFDELSAHRRRSSAIRSGRNGLPKAIPAIALPDLSLVH